MSYSRPLDVEREIVGKACRVRDERQIAEQRLVVVARSESIERVQVDGKAKKSGREKNIGQKSQPVLYQPVMICAKQ